MSHGTTPGRAKADKDGTRRIVTTINDLVKAYSPEKVLSHLLQIEKKLEQQRSARLFSQIAEAPEAAGRSEMIRNSGKGAFGNRNRRMSSLAGKPQIPTGLEGAAYEPGEGRAASDV